VEVAGKDGNHHTVIAIMPQKEQEIKKAIADYLRLKRYLVINHRNVGIWKKDTNRYIPLPSGEKGVSDLICLSPQGTLVAIEVKTKAGKPTADQLSFLERVRKNKGIGMLAHSLDEVMKEL
jgi:Holliday junction resolvase-like predicted endonuclease